MHWAHACARSSDRRSGEVAAAGRALTTTWTSGEPANRGTTRCRRRRFTRLRVTALPTALDTTKPTRDGGLLVLRACTTRVGLAALTPPRTDPRKSDACRIRFWAGSTRTRQADSSERPLRRRAAMMARPARVLMRARKPWVRLRRRLLGWKVRLVTGITPFVFDGGTRNRRSTLQGPFRHGEVRRRRPATGQRYGFVPPEGKPILRLATRGNELHRCSPADTPMMPNLSRTPACSPESRRSIVTALDTGLSTGCGRRGTP